jgi:hypothetical protein
VPSTLKARPARFVWIVTWTVGVGVGVTVGLGVAVGVGVGVGVTVGVGVAVGVGDGTPADCLSWKASCWELPLTVARQPMHGGVG